MASNLNPATFWNSTMVEPKRQFRFYISFGQMGDGPTFACKSIGKPTVQLEATEHKFLNHTFRYPNRAVWQPISVVLVDTADPDMSATLLGILRQAGYTWPENMNAASTCITKAQATSPFDLVTITQIGKPLPVGGATKVPSDTFYADMDLDIIDQWTLNNAWMGGTIDFGGDLGYENDGLVEVKFDLQYDFAYMTAAGGVRGGWADKAAPGLVPRFASPLDNKG